MTARRTREPAEEHASDAAVTALLAASRALVAVSARSIADASDVTLPQFRMLVVLDHGESNLSALARSLDVAASTALRMVDRLVEAGLVERTVPPENRREIRLSLTAEGRGVVESVTARRQRDLQLVVGHLPEEQLDHLTRAMALFADAAETLWPIARSSLSDGL